MNHQAVLRVATIQLAEGGRGGGAVELLNWTNYFYHFPSAELYFFTLCLKEIFISLFSISLLSTMLHP